MSRVTIVVLLACLASAGCGSDPSPAETFCSTAQACGELHPSVDVATCAARAEELGGSRAIAECASCVTSTTCGMAHDECDAACGPYWQVLAEWGESGVPLSLQFWDLDDQQVDRMCTWSVEHLGDRADDVCDPFLTAHWSMERCRAITRCNGRVEVQEFENCFVPAQGACDLERSDACSFVVHC